MTAPPEVVIVYDQHCPVCDYYSHLVRIRESVGRLVLVDAREDSTIMAEITARGMDIDQGMVVKVEDQFYYGADAVHVLARMGTRQGMFNRVAFWVFRSRVVSRAIYPLLRTCRNLLLKALGRTRVNNLGTSRSTRY